MNLTYLFFKVQYLSKHWFTLFPEGLSYQQFVSGGLILWDIALFPRAIERLAFWKKIPTRWIFSCKNFFKSLQKWLSMLICKIGCLVVEIYWFSKKKSIKTCVLMENYHYHKRINTFSAFVMVFFNILDYLEP